MTQRNVRGAYMNFEHDRVQDWDWLAKWQPNVIRYMGPGSIADPNSFDVNRVRRIHDTCPDATILLRCWDVDDNNFKAHDAMVADPHAEADRQVDWWANVFNRAAAAGVPRNLLMAGLNNETGPEKDAALYQYTEWALKYGIKQNVRLGVFVFSVGRPSLPGEAEWTIDSFARLEPLILANNGAIVLHQYAQPEGMYAVWTDDKGNERKDWTYLMGRDLRWPTHVPIIIGEWGLDGILYNRHPDPKYGNSGWRNFKAEWPPNRYADEYVECVRQANDNVIGICPFLSDFSDHKWQSFDLLDAYGEFLARKDLCVKEVATIPIVSPGPQPVPLPQPPVKPVEPVPSIPTGIIEPRVAQAILKVESGGRTHGEDGRIIIRFEAHIFKRYLGNDALFDQHFRYDQTRPWVNQQWRRVPSKDTWQLLHTGKQADEWAAFEFANSLNADASFMAISMGAAQIMGFNHARIGYSSAADMFTAFRDPLVQTIGFINFFLSDPALADAMRRKDWREIAKRYNGSGAVDTYAPLLEKAYKELGGS